MQICGLIILLLLLYFHKRNETVGLYSERLFCYVLYITMLNISLDILSIVLINNMEHVPSWLVCAESKMYLASLVWTGYLALVYVDTDIYSMGNGLKNRKLLAVIAVAFSIAIILLPISIYTDGESSYVYGASVIATYIGALSMILCTIYNTLRHKGMMNRHRSRAVLMWMAIWVVAAVVQFFNNEILLVGFAGAMGVTILFFELENPESYLDKRTGFFNTHAYTEYMNQCYERHIKICGFRMVFENVHFNDLTSDDMDNVMLDVMSFSAGISGIRIFKTIDREYVLMFENPNKMEQALEIVEKRFEEYSADPSKAQRISRMQPYFIVLYDIGVTKDMEELAGVVRNIKARNAGAVESFRVVVNENEIKMKRSRDAMLITLLGAIEDDRIEVFFQPIYSTRDKRYVSAEALVRIRKEDGSIIMPGMFIPVAEETDIISRLGEIIFEKTCRFIKEKKPEKYGIEYIEVNLSVTQCERRELAGNFMEIMQNYGISPSMINLEITETASTAMRKTLINNMNKLIEYGVTFSLDDFGNGQSNLNYIVDLPVRIVKFDRDMIQSYFENERAKFVLRATMRMVHDMQLKVVSEGVETKEQLEALEDLGIDYIQGYYFSKPLDQESFLKFLEENNAGSISIKAATEG